MQHWKAFLLAHNAAEIRIRAERRAGELLADMELESRSHDATHLRDLGIDKHESSR